MTESTSAIIDQSDFQCNICYEIADEALESECCHKLFCKHCLQSIVRNQCPVCRASPFKTKQNVYLHRMICKLPIACSVEGCKAKVTRGNLADHIATEHKTYSCPGGKFGLCQHFTARNYDDFIAHLSQCHRDKLLENCERLFEGSTNNKQPATTPPSTNSSQSPPLSPASERELLELYASIAPSVQRGCLCGGRGCGSRVATNSNSMPSPMDTSASPYAPFTFGARPTTAVPRLNNAPFNFAFRPSLPSPGIQFPTIARSSRFAPVIPLPTPSTSSVPVFRSTAPTFSNYRAPNNGVIDSESDSD